MISCSGHAAGSGKEKPEIRSTGIEQKVSSTKESISGRVDFELTSVEDVATMYPRRKLGWWPSKRRRSTRTGENFKATEWLHRGAIDSVQNWLQYWVQYCLYTGRAAASKAGPKTAWILMLAPSRKDVEVKAERFKQVCRYVRQTPSAAVATKARHLSRSCCVWES